MEKNLLINWRDIKNPEAGGAEIYYHEIFRRLAGGDFAITVLSHRFPGAPTTETIDGVNVIRHGCKRFFNYQIIPYLLKVHHHYDLVIEANLCGTVSLSSDVPGLRDSVVDGATGILYTPNDADDFHQKAVRLLTDLERRSVMEEAARSRARTFDWDSMAARMADYLRALNKKLD